MERSPRQRNRRGQGGRLREEIIHAATVLLERTGAEESVTLRAVAREVGITAPSIAPHFTDRAGIIDAVVGRELQVLYDLLLTAAKSTDDAVESLFAICGAYVRYGRAYPNRYRVLVGRRFLDVWEERDISMEQTAPLMAAAIRLVSDTIQRCIDTGASSGTDAYTDTLVLWFSLHGLVIVPWAIPSVPWPDEEALLTACVVRNAQLRTDSLPSQPKLS